MTSNERKILECIWNHNGEAHIHLVSSKTGFSSDYGRFLCHALKKAGHLEFTERDFCRLSEKGHEYFQSHNNIGIVAASFIPQENSTGDPTPSTIFSGNSDYDKDGEPKEDERIEEGESQEANPDEKREEDSDKKIEELSSSEDDEKIDSTPPASDGGNATPETGENANGDDIKRDKEETDKPAANPIDNIVLMIKKFAGSLMGSTKIAGSGRAAHG